MKEAIFHYDYFVFAVSIFISIFACLTTFDLLARGQKASRKRKIPWMLSGAFMMGVGICSMHYTATIAAAKPDSLLTYNPVMITGTLVLVVGMIFVSLYIVFKKRSRHTIFSSAVLLGSAHLITHYNGLNGEISKFFMDLDFRTAGPAVFAAIFISYFSIFLFKKIAKENFSSLQVPAAIFMGIGFSLIHYMDAGTVGKHLHAASPSELLADWRLQTDAGSMLILIMVINFLLVGIMHTLAFREQRKHEAEKVKMTFYDELTGLPNRKKYLQYIQKAVKRAEISDGTLAVLFIDLDRFKIANHTLGHHLGDQLLLQVASRLESAFPNSMLARHGGDEFIIVQEGSDYHQAKKAAELILEQFTDPFMINGKEFFLTSSIGIALYPKDGNSANLVTKQAYKALLSIQNGGTHQYQFYLHKNDKEQARRMQLEIALQSAIRNNELQLHYQPQIYLKTGEVVGAEALLRWKHPELGNISPAEFIPIAESTGMIISIGKWVIQEACRQINTWQRNGIHMKVAVNVSALQFQDEQFFEVVNEALSKSLFPPKYLELELTESVMHKMNQSSLIINKLKNIGIKVSIDDFGTGYSSLSILSALPIDMIKIDRSFVHKMMELPATATLVKTIIEMGNNLHFGLIAEGIESEDQAEFLLQNGCHYGQGYLYSPPISPDEFETFIERQDVV